ncbi:TetR family transcriptional regulator [Paenibacillus protaetiae]|uniref:TetR/AcrR family transcriptional regulator n=1 Tax=Paenibacillus protaetiae TaxID=2509456 RepID=A0A4P6EWA2_9BACL|nr:TetR family transcriptional regulator [Paenibacillus protaetiae]QAY66875.1 TetR/AcrR family transcriptional regulator [Paenibacillus protaetiae]
MSSSDGDVKLRILLTAKRLFAKQGYDGTTVRQICEEANANIALISYYFGGKENLFGQIFEQFFPNELINQIDPAMDAVEGVKLFIREVSSFRHSDPEISLIIQREVSFETPRTDKIRQHMSPMWFRLRGWLEAGKREGRFRFRSLDSAFMSIMGVLLFAREDHYWDVVLKREEETIEEKIANMTEFILNGLGMNAAQQ